MFRSDTKISLWAHLALAILPFFFLFGSYVWYAHHVHELNAHEETQTRISSKYLPLPSQMLDGFVETIETDAADERKVFLDTGASLARFSAGMAIVSLGVIVGLYMGVFPIFKSMLYYLFVFLDKVHPMLLLPIVFMIFGTGELAKLSITVVGVLPGVVLDAYRRTREIPKEHFFLGQTQGLSESELAWSVAFPQILPRMIGTMRANFKAAWSYVIAGEAVVAGYGIGYRIIVLKRMTEMDIIYSYVLWATVIMFVLDYLFQWLEQRYRWVDK